MIQPVASTAPPTPAPVTKPWKMGDPSSFEQLFSSYSAPATDAPPKVVAAPPPAATSFTFEDGGVVSGYGVETHMNPEELATADTANKIAAMLGGKVENAAAFGGEWKCTVPTRNIVVAAADAKAPAVTLNAGIMAYLFNTYGTRAGSPAWQQINQVLRRDLLSTTPVA